MTSGLEKLDQALGGARHVDVTAEAYHDDPAWGASMLELFRENRRLCYERCVVRTAPHPPASPAQNFGTLVHLGVLEPERFPEVVADPLPDKAPDGKPWLRRKGSDHEKWWAEELAKRDGKIACDAETLDRVANVVEAIRSNARAKQLLSQRGGQSEYSIFWHETEYGLDCKCRVDWYADIPLDLKTTCDASPREYARSLVSLGYARKMAHYHAGLRALRGEPTPFVHIAAESVPPYRVACYQIDDRDRDGIQLGVAQRRRTLFQLAECLATGDWREAWERAVVTLQLPSFAFQEDQWQY